MKVVKLSERSKGVLTRCQGQTTERTEQACAPSTLLHDIFDIKCERLTLGPNK